MSTYVSLVHWTDQGVRNFQDSTHRADEYAKLVDKAGGRVREMLWTVGEYDMVSIADFPDEETATMALLDAGSTGNVRTTTMRAFSEEEIAGIVRRAN